MHRSCIFFASLYRKTSYPRNGNLPHNFYHFWGGSGGQTSTHCTQTPEMVICLVFFTDSGVCVQFLRKRKFMYVFDNYLRLLLVQYLVLYYRESETRKNDVLSSQFECCHLRSSPPPPRRSRSVYCQCTTTTNSKRKSTVIHHHLFLDHDVPKT